MGTYKSGEKRYEIRHFNDLKLAHKDSPAACARRPALGRPPVLVKSPDSTEAEPPVPTPENLPDNFPSSEMSTNFPSGQAAGRGNFGSTRKQNHATSSTENEVPASLPTHADHVGPPSIKPFQSRQPSRSTRNPSPKYVDAIWIASPSQIDELNRSIGA